MGHMMGSKFLDQEVASEGALVCVCACVSLCVYVRGRESLVNLSVTKRLGLETRPGAASWLSAISSIKRTYLASGRFDRSPEIPLSENQLKIIHDMSTKIEICCHSNMACVLSRSLHGLLLAHKQT